MRGCVRPRSTLPADRGVSLAGARPPWMTAIPYPRTSWGSPTGGRLTEPRTRQAREEPRVPREKKRSFRVRCTPLVSTDRPASATIAARSTARSPRRDRLRRRNGWMRVAPPPQAWKSCVRIHPARRPRGLPWFEDDPWGDDVRVPASSAARCVGRGWRQREAVLATPRVFRGYAGVYRGWGRRLHRRGARRILDAGDPLRRCLSSGAPQRALMGTPSAMSCRWYV